MERLDGYGEERDWRFERRRNPNIFGDTLRRIMRTDPLPYRRLIA